MKTLPSRVSSQKRRDFRRLLRSLRRCNLWREQHAGCSIFGKRGLFHLLDREALLHAVRLARSRFVKRGLILGYHSIRDQAQDPFGMGVSTENFRQHMEILREHAHVLAVGELLSLVRRGRLPARSVAITFDDGYADNLQTALPLLQRQGFPATIFITTGYFGKEFWWDTLARLVYSAENADWIASRLRSTRFESRGGGRLTQFELARQLGDLLIALRSRERSACLEELRTILDVEPDQAPSAVALTESQTTALAGSPLVEIGSHTVSHPVLDRLSVAEQRAEIADSKAALERVTGRAIVGFAFPHGSPCRTSVQILGAVGFEYACSGDTDIVWRRTNRFSLPRVWVPNCRGDVFLQRLNRWF